MDEADGLVERVFALPSIPPVIAINEVGHLISSNLLNCGMAMEETSTRPVLKIFNHHGSTVEEEDTSRKDNGKKYLLLRNKRTNKISIYGTKVTYLKKPDYYKVKSFEDSSLQDKNHAFNEVFGTKKSSRISKSRTNDTIINSTDVFTNISTTSKSVEETLTHFAEFSIYLPSGCNRFSSKIESIYPVSTLLLENEVDLMTDYAKEIISMLPISNDEEDLSKFFVANMNRLSHKTIQNICLLTLADGLVELLQKKTGELNYRSSTIYPNSDVINDKLMDNFLEYNQTGVELSSKMKDKAVCHLIIIMILINMNCLDLGWISPFLPMSTQKRLILLMKVVGATPSKEDKTKYTLKIPLASLPTFQKQPKRSK